MIVTCEQCRTQFQLDDAKVPATGIRVRCSRCKCAFFVESPHPPVPDPAADLPVEATASEPAFDPGGGEAESDWTFSDDVDPVLGPSGADEDLVAARDAVNDLLGGDASDPVTGVANGTTLSDVAFDLAAEEFATDGEAADAQTSTGLAASPDDSFDPNAITIDHGSQGPAAGLAFGPDLDPGSTGDRTASGNGATTVAASALETGIDLAQGGPGEADSDWSIDGDWSADSDWSAEPDETTGAEGSADLDEPFAGDLAHEAPVALATEQPQSDEPFEDSSAQPAHAASPEIGADGGAGSPVDDLGSPENWDFFDGGDAKPTGASFEAFGEGTPSDEAVGGFLLPLELDADPTPEYAWISHVRGAIGWTLVVGMSLYVIAMAFLPSLPESSGEPSAVRLAGLEAARVEGRWVDNAVAGSIYVVSGAFHPSGGAQADSGTALRVRLLDASGNAVAAETAAVGPSIPTERLRESDPEDLRVAQERAAPGLLRDPLARRKRRSFMAVLSSVPPEAVAFEFQIASADITAANFDESPLEPFDSNAQAALAAEGQVVPATEATERSLATRAPSEVSPQAASPAEQSPGVRGASPPGIARSRAESVSPGPATAVLDPVPAAPAAGGRP